MVLIAGYKDLFDHLRKIQPFGNKNTTFGTCAKAHSDDMFKDLMHAAREDANAMRVLVAFEEDYRIYQEAVAYTIQALRSHVEISLAELDMLEAEAIRLAPHLIICSRSNTVDAYSTHAWLQLPTEHDDRLAELCLDGEYSEVNDPGLDELLRVVDEAERLIRTKANPRRSC